MPARRRERPAAQQRSAAQRSGARDQEPIAGWLGEPIVAIEEQLAVLPPLPIVRDARACARSQDDRCAGFFGYRRN
jgi:hypothetical protein